MSSGLLVASIVIGASGALLLVAGVFHLVNASHLLDALRTLPFPARVMRSVALLIGLVELSVGLFAILVPLAGDPTQMSRSAAVAGSVYLSFTAWLMVARWRAPSAPCGCSPHSTPVTNTVVARSGGLGALNLIAAAWLADPSRNGVVGAVTSTRLGVAILIVVSASAFAALLWVLPVALFDPLEAREAGA